MFDLISDFMGIFESQKEILAGAHNNSPGSDRGIDNSCPGISGCSVNLHVILTNYF